MKVRFLKHWLAMSEDERKALIKDQKQYQQACDDVQAIYASNSDPEKIALEILKQAGDKMESAGEYIKMRMKVLPIAGEKYEELAVAALERDSERDNKVEVAANLMRRLLKSGGQATAFKAKAKEIFKYAKCFE